MNVPELPETQEPVKKPNRIFVLAGALTALLLLSVAGVYGWRNLLNPCEVADVEQAATFLGVQLSAYDDLYRFTTTVYQGGINSPVSKMQQIFMDTQSAAVPACMQTAKDELLSYMGTVIRAFRAFEAGEAESTVRGMVDESNTHYDLYRSELEEVRACAPFCFR